MRPFSSPHPHAFPCTLLLGFLLSVSCLSNAPAGAADAPLAGPGPGLLAPGSDGAGMEFPDFDPAVSSPAQVLGYPLGSRFTPHPRILAALDALDATSARVAQFEYGSSTEGRPLRLLAISSPGNLARIDEIRRDVARLAGGRLDSAAASQLAADLPVLVWLAYGIHGNESSSSEAALAAAYWLAAAKGEWEKRLEKVVVLLDPLSNPDGRERYVAGFVARAGVTVDLDPDSAQHLETWPGGRYSHYLFDLNRDWAWLTQAETRQRVSAYRGWEPQVYVDFHEMSRESTYFFPPAADPVHPEIGQRTLGWLKEFGRANAGAFDRRGWPYYTHETYDLFYPGYGDAYPNLRGAIGMTYEMAGGGRAGLAVRLRSGSTLTLADRVLRHLTTSLETVATAVAQRRALLESFAAARAAGAQAAQSKTYLWGAEQPEARNLAILLRNHGVEVKALRQATAFKARGLRGEAEQRREFAAGTFAVSTRQPLASLVRALLEKSPELAGEFVRAQRRKLEDGADPEFYDITAWSLPLAWNLEAWVGDDDLPAASVQALDEDPPGELSGTGDLGWAIPPQGLASTGAVANLMWNGIRVRWLTEGFRGTRDELPAGTVFIPRTGNPSDTERRLAELALSAGVDVRRVGGGFAERGASLGSTSAVLLRPGRIALVRGSGVDATSFGALWFLFDRELALPHVVLELDSLARLDLGRFDVLVLPDGSGYAKALGDEGKARIDRWVRDGGQLVAIGGAMSWAKQAGLLDIKAWEPPKRPADSEDAVPPSVEAWVADHPLETPGAILRTRMRGKSPLLAGLPSAPPVLFSGEDVWLASGDPKRDVLVAAEDPILAGFAWPEAKQRLSAALLVTAQSLGEGQVVGFAQDPAFRMLWRGTLPLLLNAVVYRPGRG